MGSYRRGWGSDCMKCVICKKVMKIVKKDTSADFRNKKKYSRVVYHCKKDDVWIVVEKPKNK